MSPELKQGSRQTKQHFNRIYKTGIAQLIEAEGAAGYMSFLLIFCGIDALAGWHSGREDHGVKSTFNDFVKKYFEPRYHSLRLFEARNELVHNFAIKSFEIRHKQKSRHLQTNKEGKLILNSENFFDAFQDAAKQYFDEVKTCPALQANFDKRLTHTELFQSSYQNTNSVQTVHVGGSSARIRIPVARSLKNRQSS